MNNRQSSKLIWTVVVLSLLILQVAGQKLPAKDFDNGLQLINQGLELKAESQRLEQEFQNERDQVKAAKLKEDAADSLKKSREVLLQAVDAFERAVKADSTSFSAHYYLGWAFNELDQYSKAIVPLDKPRRLNPGDSSTNFELGWAYDRSEEFAKASELFEIAVTLKPDYSEAWFELGWTSEKMEQYPRAIKSYKQVINLKPDNARAYYNLALVYLKLGNKSAAREQQVILKTLDSDLANILDEAIRK
jgi:tetratricopeptide (TPR) repeat protein